MPNTRPTAAVARPASGTAKNTGHPEPLLMQAEAKAPKPKNAACPIEICPVKPTSRLSPSAAMPR